MLTSAGLGRVDPSQTRYQRSLSLLLSNLLRTCSMASGPIHTPPLKGKFEFGDREEDQGDDQGQSGHHEEVNHGALEAEEVRETYDHDPPVIRMIQRIAGNP